MKFIEVHASVQALIYQHFQLYQLHRDSLKQIENAPKMHHFYNTVCGRVATSLWGGYFCIHWLGEYLSLCSHKQVNIFDLDNKTWISGSVSCFDIIEQSLNYEGGHQIDDPLFTWLSQFATTIPQVTLVQLAPECVSQHTKKRASLPASWQNLCKWFKHRMDYDKGKVTDPLVYKMRHRLAMPCVG